MPLQSACECVIEQDAIPTAGPEAAFVGDECPGSCDFTLPYFVVLQLQEQLTELEHERDLLKESNAKLLNRFGAVRTPRQSQTFLNVSAHFSLGKVRVPVSLSIPFVFQCLRRVSGAEVADPGAAAAGADSPAGESSEG